MNRKIKKNDSVNNDQGNILYILKIVNAIVILSILLWIFFAFYYIISDYDIPPTRIINSGLDLVGVAYFKFPLDPSAYWLSTIMNLFSLWFANASNKSSKKQFAEIRTELNKILRLSKNIERKS